MAGKQGQFSEVSNNEIWREAIRRETNALKNQNLTYSCNLNALKKDQVTPKLTRGHDAKRALTEEEDAMATKILNDYGIKTEGADPSSIRIPGTSNSQYGLYNFYEYPDERRGDFVRKGCEETKYAKNFYTMTGKSAYSKQL